jgi:Protein of unknown function (DUF2752)
MAIVSDMVEPELTTGLLVPVETTDEDARRRMARTFHLKDRHWSMLWLSLAVVVCAFLLKVDAGGGVAPNWFPRATLPGMCFSRTWLGIECPGCGLTRSFIALAHGDLSASLAYHRVGWVLALAVLLQFPYRMLALRELRTGVVERTWPQWFGWALIATLLGSWIGAITGLF